MRYRLISSCLSLVVILPGVAAGQIGRGQQPGHALVACADSQIAGRRPANSNCAILARKQFDSVREGSLVLRLETFSSTDAALRVGAPASAVVQAGGKVWLITFGVKGERSAGGQFVTEIGPVAPLPRASRYEMQVSEADFGPDMNPAISNAIHTHSGPEFWFLLTGEQCLETPAGVTRARAGEGMFAPAEIPMQLNIAGSSKRDALFVVVHDAARPVTTVSDWQPKASCQK